MIVKGVFLLPGLPPPNSSLRPHSLLYWAVIISTHVGVGTQEKRGVHFPHTLFFPFPISLPLNYINEYSASLHSPYPNDPPGRAFAGNAGDRISVCVPPTRMDKSSSGSSPHFPAHTLCL